MGITYMLLFGGFSFSVGASQAAVVQRSEVLLSGGCQCIELMGIMIRSSQFRCCWESRCSSEGPC